MATIERVPEYIRSRYVTWKSEVVYGRKQWLKRAVESEELYYNDVDGTGTPFTGTQFAKIREVTGIPVSVNILYPVLNQKLAILTQTKPSMKTISMDGRARNHALVLDKMKHGVLYNSNAPLEIEGMVKDMLISGMGHVMVVPANQYQNGMFGVALVNVPYDEVILDINAKKRNLEDMEGFFIEKAFTLPKAKQLYGDILSQLTDEVGNPIDIDMLTSEVWIENEVTDKQDVTTGRFNMDARIVVREFYEHIYTNLYIVPEEESGVYQYIFAENLEEDALPMLANAVAELPGMYIKRTLMMGDYVIHEEVLPISQYPLKTAFFEWGGRPYRSYGMIHFTKDMQHAFDKIMQIMLLNGILSNNAGWNAPKGAIPEADRHKWEDYANNPRVIKEYVPKVVGNQVLKPERDPVQQLSNFYPMVLDMLKNGIEYSTGINAIVQGNAQEAGVDVFSSLQQYQNAAMMRIILSTTHVNNTLSELGQVLTEYLTSNITPAEYQFFDESGNLNELRLAKEIANDIKLYRYLTVSIPATSMPTQRLAVSTELMKIAQTTPDATERSLYTQTAMDLAEIREFADLRQKLDVVRNTQSQLQQLQESYDRLTETGKQLENKYINTQLENRILKQLMSKEKAITEAYAKMESKVTVLEEVRKIMDQGEKSSE